LLMRTSTVTLVSPIPACGLYPSVRSAAMSLVAARSQAEPRCAIVLCMRDTQDRGPEGKWGPHTVQALDGSAVIRAPYIPRRRPLPSQAKEAQCVAGRRVHYRERSGAV
jgi:hypothetical protein